MIRALSRKKAIPAFLVGIAFFLVSCHPKVAVKKVPEKVTVADLWAQAEDYRQGGKLEEALNTYVAYLEKYPKGDKSVMAAHRMADIYMVTGRFAKALDLLMKISTEAPDYRGMPSVQYQLARVLYLQGEHRRSREAAIGWLRKFPAHSLRGEVLTLLGKNLASTGDIPLAFRWWIRAKKATTGDALKQERLHNRLEALIRLSNTVELGQMADYAQGGVYAPQIYFRMAGLFLERDDLEKAREAALLLMRSAKEESWLSRGQALLQQIREAKAMKKGVIGCLLPLSGPFAIYGQEVLNGIELGIGLFGEDNTGVDLELVIRDTKGQVERAVKGFQDLVINEKALAVLGPLTSKTAAVVAQKAQDMGAPIIALAQNPGLTEGKDMVFRGFLTPSQETKWLLDLTLGKMGLKRFAILYPENSYGRFFMNLFRDNLEKMGGTVTAAESYLPEETDFSKQVKKMTGLYNPRPLSLVQAMRQSWSPAEEESRIYPEEPEPIVDFDAVFIPDNAERVAMIASHLVYHDVTDVLLLGTSLLQSHQLIELAGDYVQGAVFPAWFFPGSGMPDVKAFVKSYQANFETVPGTLAAVGYDTIRFIKGVLAGEKIRSRMAFQRAIIMAAPFQGVTGKISFDTQGEAKKEPLLLTVSGKKIIPLQPLY